MDLDYLLSETIRVSKLAGKFIQDERKNFNFSKIEYKGQNDLVSYVDKEAEKLLVENLQHVLLEDPQRLDVEHPTGFFTVDMDIDLDGDADLVCGNAGQGDTMYRNDGGRLTPVAPA